MYKGLIIVMTLTLIGAGCQVSVTPQGTDVNKESLKGSMSPVEAVMKKEGKMVKMKEDGSVLEMVDEMMMADGTKVMPDGKIKMTDGKEMMIEEGESLLLDDGAARVAKIEPVEDVKLIEENQVVVEKQETLLEEKTKMMRKGSYEEYSANKLSYAEDGTVVIFFHAGWCPTCRIAEENITSNPIPDGLTILKTNYDNSSELRKKYQVTYQHTFVQVDSNGNLIKKWGSSNTIEQIVTKINS
jgi:thiol-disulfide isomerase/thioredoxin